MLARLVRQEPNGKLSELVKIRYFSRECGTLKGLVTKHTTVMSFCTSIHLQPLHARVCVCVCVGGGGGGGVGGGKRDEYLPPWGAHTRLPRQLLNLKILKFHLFGKTVKWYQANRIPGSVSLETRLASYTGRKNRTLSELWFPTVTAWEGGQSAVDSQLHEDSGGERDQRDSDDEWNESIDRGKVK